MSTPSVRVFVLFVLVIAVFFVLIGFANVFPVSAAPLNAPVGDEPKPACTMASSWWERFWKLCNDLGVATQTSVDTVAADTKQAVAGAFDPAKWNDAAQKANAWILAQGGNGDPSSYADGNKVNEITWRYYCDSWDRAPVFDVKGNPVCN